MKQKHWKVSVFNKTSETIKNDTFYTTDTEAYLIFELIDEDFAPDSATVTVYNIYGKATINARAEIVGGIVQYEMPEEAIGHPGGWRTQVIFIEDGEDYTTKIIEFDVGGHLLDNKKPAIVDIENWNSFIAHAGELIDDWEQLEEIRQTNEQQRELAESVRQNEFEANETGRQTNELVREKAENNRQSTFETNETERQNEFETNEDERENTFEINESTRQANELIREEAEGNRQSTFEKNEVGRQSEFEENEQGRESAESVRVSNEAERISKDGERDSKIDSKADVSELELYAKKEQEDWITPTLLNGVEDTSGQPIRFMKDEFGFVHINGRAINAVLRAPIFVLPQGYRPDFTVSMVGNGGGGSHVMFSIGPTTGNVSVLSGNLSYITLDGISFYAGGD